MNIQIKKSKGGILKIHHFMPVKGSQSCINAISNSYLIRGIFPSTGSEAASLTHPSRNPSQSLI